MDKETGLMPAFGAEAVLIYNVRLASIAAKNSIITRSAGHFN